MKLSKRESIILYLTVFIGAAALAFVYIIEPRLQYLTMPDEMYSRYKNYSALLDRKPDINKRYESLTSSKYWKNSPEEQQVALQKYLEELARSSGVIELISIRPAEIKEAPPFSEISVQLDARASLQSAVQFIYRSGSGPMPVKVQKLQIYSEETYPKVIKMQVVAAFLWMPPGESR